MDDPSRRHSESSGAPPPFLNNPAPPPVNNPAPPPPFLNNPAPPPSVNNPAPPPPFLNNPAPSPSVNNPAPPPPFLNNPAPPSVNNPAPPPPFLNNPAPPPSVNNPAPPPSDKNLAPTPPPSFFNNLPPPMGNPESSDAMGKESGTQYTDHIYIEDDIDFDFLWNEIPGNEFPGKRKSTAKNATKRAKGESTAPSTKRAKGESTATSTKRAKGESSAPSTKDTLPKALQNVPPSTSGSKDPSLQNVPTKNRAIGARPKFLIAVSTTNVIRHDRLPKLLKTFEDHGQVVLVATDTTLRMVNRSMISCHVYTNIEEIYSLTKDRFLSEELATQADHVVVIASSHDLGKIALGLTEDLVTSVATLYPSKVLVVPYVSPSMWNSVAIRQHVFRLTALGYRVCPNPGLFAAQSTVNWVINHI